jgi:hypothetical protein
MHVFSYTDVVAAHTAPAPSGMVSLPFDNDGVFWFGCAMIFRNISIPPRDAIGIFTTLRSGYARFGFLGAGCVKSRFERCFVLQLLVSMLV